MKKFMFMLTFATGTFFAKAQDAPAAVDPNAPDIKWESTTIDYGTVNKGDEGAATRYFKFTNVGKSPLIISSCHGSCGCTVPQCPTEPTLPGKSGEIKVHYDINRVGPFTKTVSVSSNAKNPSETLKITGTVNDVAAGTPAPAVVAPAPTPAVATPAHSTAPTSKGQAKKASHKPAPKK